MISMSFITTKSYCYVFKYDIISRSIQEKNIKANVLNVETVLVFHIGASETESTSPTTWCAMAVFSRHCRSNENIFICFLIKIIKCRFANTTWFSLPFGLIQTLFCSCHIYVQNKFVNPRTYEMIYFSLFGFFVSMRFYSFSRFFDFMTGQLCKRIR